MDHAQARWAFERLRNGIVGVMQYSPISSELIVILIVLVNRLNMNATSLNYHVLPHTRSSSSLAGPLYFPPSPLPPCRIRHLQ